MDAEWMRLGGIWDEIGNVLRCNVMRSKVEYGALDFNFRST